MGSNHSSIFIRDADLFPNTRSFHISSSTFVPIIHHFFVSNTTMQNPKIINPFASLVVNLRHDVLPVFLIHGQIARSSNSTRTFLIGLYDWFRSQIFKQSTLPPQTIHLIWIPGTTVYLHVVWDRNFFAEVYEHLVVSSSILIKRHSKGHSAL